jgi:hypothetical protein
LENKGNQLESKQNNMSAKMQKNCTFKIVPKAKKYSHIASGASGLLLRAACVVLF